MNVHIYLTRGPEPVLALRLPEYDVPYIYERMPDLVKRACNLGLTQQRFVHTYNKIDSDVLIFKHRP